MNRYLIQRIMDEDRDERRDRNYRDRREDDDDDDDRDRASRGSGGGRSSGSRGGNRGGSSRGGSYSRGGGNRGGDRNYSRGDRRYDDYDYEMDFEYNDRHNKSLELSEKDLKEWEKELENADGSRGAKFDKDKIIPLAEQFGIKFKKFTEDEFVATVNMMYADYCEAVRDMMVPNYQKPEPYIHLAKAFLCDEDFEGKPYEKLALYYYTIVDFE